MIMIMITIDDKLIPDVISETAIRILLNLLVDGNPDLKPRTVPKNIIINIIIICVVILKKCINNDKDDNVFLSD